jgi:hypothetical protein
VLDRLAVPPLPALQAEPLLGRLAFDKKARAGGLGWVLLRAPGRGEHGVRLEADEVAGELTRFLGRSARGSL